MIHRVARTDATVLIAGETGTGKELIAQSIHQNSLRRDKPFIKVNCAAVSETLIESEFFGHEKGAFTGATNNRIGRFELADGGTLLLDEISEVSLALQAKLLRVLQENELERVGGTKTIKVDVRILATTNRNCSKPLTKVNFEKTSTIALMYSPLFLLHFGSVRVMCNHWPSTFWKSSRVSTARRPRISLSGPTNNFANTDGLAMSASYKTLLSVQSF